LHYTVAVNVLLYFDGSVSSRLLACRCRHCAFVLLLSAIWHCAISCPVMLLLLLLFVCCLSRY
jgi:hypothetical protein